MSAPEAAVSEDWAARSAAHLLWDISDLSDPHLDRELMALLTVAALDGEQARAVLREVLCVFKVVAQEQPAVVSLLLGRALNVVPAEEPER